MAASVTVPCECCEGNEPNTNCTEITGFSSDVVGTPGCVTTADISVSRRFIATPLGGSPTPQEVKDSIQGSFSVDCSQEVSGYCRDRQMSGTYPWSDATYESSPNSGDGASYSMSFLFEDCGISPGDLRVTISLRYIGSCYRPSGVSGCDESCRDDS